MHNTFFFVWEGVGGWGGGEPFFYLVFGDPSGRVDALKCSVSRVRWQGLMFRAKGMGFEVWLEVDGIAYRGCRRLIVDCAEMVGKYQRYDQIVSHSSWRQLCIV